MTSSKNKPPQFFLNFFRWFCHPEFQEEIEGDLMERYQNFSEQYGHLQAKWFFIKEVFLLFRPSMMGNFHQLTTINSIIMVKENKRLFGIILTVGGLLLIPLVAMHFTAEVNWTVADFIVMAVLLLSTGLLSEFVWRKVRSFKSKIIIISAILFAFLLVWAELAVGIFGTPFAGN